MIYTRHEDLDLNIYQGIYQEIKNEYDKASMVDMRG